MTVIGGYGSEFIESELSVRTIDRDMAPAG